MGPQRASSASGRNISSGGSSTVLAIVLALVSALGYGASDFAAGVASRAASVLQVTVLSEGLSMVLLLIVVPWVSSQSPSAAALWWGAFAGFAEVVGTFALYLGFRHAAFSVASSLSAVGSAAFAVIAGLALGERPGTLALVGIAIALPAIVAVSASSDEPDEADEPQSSEPQASEPQPSKPEPGGPEESAPEPGAPAAAGGRPRGATGRHALGVVLGILAGAGFAGMFIGLNQAGNSHDLWPAVTAQAAALATALIAAAAGRQLLHRPTAHTTLLAGLTGAAGTVGLIFYFLATHLGLLAITAVITSLYPASTIVLARAMLSERLTRFRIAGLCLAAASVALIAISGAG
jgi:drug/metabolite transporter (DMT)-like permease